MSKSLPSSWRVESKSAARAFDGSAAKRADKQSTLLPKALPTTAVTCGKCHGKHLGFQCAPPIKPNRKRW